MKKNSPLSKVNAIKKSQELQLSYGEDNNLNTEESVEQTTTDSELDIEDVSVDNPAETDFSMTKQNDRPEKKRNDNSPLNKLRKNNISSIEKKETENKKTNNDELNKTNNNKIKQNKKKSASLLEKINKTENIEKSEPSNKPSFDPNVQKTVADKDTIPESIDYDVYEEELLAEDLLKSRKEEKYENNRRIIRKITAFLLILGCVYLIFLIYGACNTKYVYSDTGEIVAQKMTFKEIEAVENFNEFSAQYLRARVIYEKALTLDYRVAAGVEDPIVVAPEYEELLNDINDLSISLQALEVSSTYVQLKTMLENWVQTDVAVYCQRMSEAISQNNSQYAEQALQYRNIMYNDFSLITENLVIIGQSLGCIDLENIVNWSPESYVQENIGGIIE